MQNIRDCNRFQINVEMFDPTRFKAEFVTRQSGDTIWTNLKEITGILKVSAWIRCLLF